MLADMHGAALYAMADGEKKTSAASPASKRVDKTLASLAQRKAAAPHTPATCRQAPPLMEALPFRFFTLRRKLCV